MPIRMKISDADTKSLLPCAWQTEKARLRVPMATFVLTNANNRLPRADRAWAGEGLS